MERSSLGMVNMEVLLAARVEELGCVCVRGNPKNHDIKCEKLEAKTLKTLYGRGKQLSE